MDIEDYRRQIQDHGAFNTVYMRCWLEDQIGAAGGQRALARQLGINVWEIGNAVSGRRAVSARLARLLGFEREDQRWIRYELLPPPQPSRQPGSQEARMTVTTIETPAPANRTLP